jgi:RNA polymerase sigma-70 factor (ECF subfamily)
MEPSGESIHNDDHKQEVALMMRIAARDELACEQLVRDYTARMHAVARRMLHSDADADDAVQDAFISIFRYAASFLGDSRLWTWMHRIVVNACLMKIRTAARGGGMTSIEALLPTYDQSGHRTQNPQSWSADAFEQAARSDMRAKVRECIDLLPESYRSVLILRDIEELDTEQAAKMLGTTSGNVKTRLHRARMALRTLLDQKMIHA